MQEAHKSIGPFKAAGIALNTVGSVAVVLDNTIQTGGNVVHQGLQGVSTITTAGAKALDLVAADMLEELEEDLKVDSTIRKATNKVRIANAEAEAARILAGLTT